MSSQSLDFSPHVVLGDYPLVVRGVVSVSPALRFLRFDCHRDWVQHSLTYLADFLVVPYPYCGCPNNTTPAEDDRVTLLVLHGSSNGRAWFGGDGRPWRGWALAAPLTEWSGVESEDGRVVILNLFLCNLMGEARFKRTQEIFLQSRNNPPTLEWFSESVDDVLWLMLWFVKSNSMLFIR